MALYHKHRPQLWQNIIGQAVIVTTIQNQINQGKPAHAYLLSGPRGVGKTTTARLIAKSLNCAARQTDSAEPCNLCSSCQDISASSALDVIEIDAASHTGVEMVREAIIESAEFQPTKSKYKIFIIDEVHMLSTSAFNALLKTLEEPPAYAIFILATTELHKLPATIISRCQRYVFKKIPREIMAARLKEIAQTEGLKIDDAVLIKLIKKSEGSARDAVSLLDQIMAIAGDSITEADVQLLLPSTSAESQLAFLQALARADIPAGLALIRSLVEGGLQPTQFLIDFIEFVRGVLLLHFDESLARREMDSTAATLEEIKVILPALPPDRLLFILDRASKRYQDARTATIPELPLELFLIECCATSTARPIETITPPVQKIEPKLIEIKPIEPPNKIAEPETKSAPPILNPEPIIQEITVPPELNMPSGKSIDKKTIENSWTTFMTKLEITGPSLVFLLKMAQIKEVTNNTITIAVQYSFHFDKLNERSTKKKLEDQLGELLNARVFLKFEVNENAGAEKTAALNDLAAAFGGEVI